MPLSHYQTQYLNQLEDYWEAHGKYPENLKKNFIQLPEFQKGLQSRGLPIPNSFPPVGITPVQRAVIKSVANYSDRRPIRKKLQDFDVSYDEYSKWLKIPEFSEKLSKAVDRAFIQETSLEAKLSLARLVQDADLGGIKYFHEFTGQFQNAETTTVQNLTYLINRLMEILVTYLEPGVLVEVADKFEAAVIQATTSELPVGKN